MKPLTGIIFFFLIFISQQTNAWSGHSHQALDIPCIESNECAVEFSYFVHLQPRMASNQWAIWIEKPDGQYVATVFATAYTARGAYEHRPLSLPMWREVSGWSHENTEYVDAVSAATPIISGRHSSIWDCRDHTGEPVGSGKYIFRMEGNIFWEHRVVWSGELVMGDDTRVFSAQPEYIPERAFRRGILLEDVRAEILVNP